MKRRDFLELGLQAGLSSLSLSLLGPKFLPNFNWLIQLDVNVKRLLPNSVNIERIDTKQIDKNWFLIVTDTDGVQGVTFGNVRFEDTLSLIKRLIIPFYKGKDARDITSLCEDVFFTDRNYKFSGMPFWNSAGHVEVAIWDLLGKKANIPVFEFFGGKKRDGIPAYLSSLNRNLDVEEELSALIVKCKELECNAIKIKVGGRMKNTPEDEARTQRLIKLMNKHLPSDIIRYADANGSYNQSDGIRIAKQLEKNGFSIFEEPCPFENYEANRMVNKAIKKMKLAGGEQDNSHYRWSDIVKDSVYDVIQPDIYYNGGILRTLKVAHLAHENGKYFAPHSPKADPNYAPFSTVIAVAPSLYGCQEYPSNAHNQSEWYSPSITINKGNLTVLNGVGLGIEYDPAILKI